MGKKKQIWGITLATVLLVISGATTMLGALVSMFFGAVLGSILPSEVGGFAGAMLIFMGLIYILLGVAYLVVAYFLWNRQTWAWWVAIVLSVIGILSGLTAVLTFNLMSVLLFALNIVVVIGLLQKKARKACKVKF